MSYRVYSLHSPRLASPVSWLATDHELVYCRRMGLGLLCYVRTERFVVCSRSLEENIDNCTMFSNYRVDKI